MFIDEEIFVKVLNSYGFTMEDLAKHKTPKAEQDWIYLIHHMHPPTKAEEMETIHHCYLYSKKNLKGKRYEQMHVKDGDLFQHVLKIKEKDLDKAPKVVYDHLNNGFKIVVKKISKKKYAVISGPLKLDKIKWSDQDRS